MTSGIEVCRFDPSYRRSKATFSGPLIVLILFEKRYTSSRLKQQYHGLLQGVWNIILDFRFIPEVNKTYEDNSSFTVLLFINLYEWRLDRSSHALFGKYTHPFLSSISTVLHSVRRIPPKWALYLCLVYDNVVHVIDGTLSVGLVDFFGLIQI